MEVGQRRNQSSDDAGFANAARMTADDDDGHIVVLD
jgi:hypothetical protein